MEVHKPKAVHGWRELLNEVGVIVIGVLIALGAEQGVEALHWRHVVHETEESLQQTVEDTYGAILSRKEMQPCVDRRLNEIQTIFDRHDRGQAIGIMGPIGSPTASVFDTYAFDMAIANQSFSHMSLSKQRKFFDPIGVYRLFNDVVKEERSVWQSLKALDRAQTLTTADWSEIRKAYDRASALNTLLGRVLRSDTPGQWLYGYRAFPEPRDYSLRQLPGFQELCRPITR